MDYTSLIWSGISFLTGLATIKAVKPVFLKLMVVVFGITIIVEILALKLPGEPTNILYNIFYFIDMSIWFYIFYKIHQKQKAIKLVVLLEALAIIFGIIESYHRWGRMHTLSIRFYSIVIIFFSILYLYHALSKEYYEVFRDPVFYVCAACILYHSLTFIKFTTISEYIFFKDGIALKVFYTLDAVANFLYYPLLCAAFIVSFYYPQKDRQCYQSSL